MMLSGGEVAVKLAGSAAKNAAAMLLALARNHKKVYGKTSLKKILQQTRDIRTFSLTPEQYREFSRQAKDKVLDAEIFAVGGDAAERFRACRMAHLARQTALFCPAAVAVHDDGDMPGQSIVFHIKLAFHDKSRRPAAFYLPKSRGFWAIWLRRLHRKVLAA